MSDGLARGDSRCAATLLRSRRS